MKQSIFTDHFYGCEEISVFPSYTVVYDAIVHGASD